MAIEVLMPRLSDTMEEGKILRWLKKVGDKVEVGDIIAEVETDKADMEMEAIDAGVLAETRVQEGEAAPVGAVIAVLSEEGVGITPLAPQKAEVSKPAVSAPPPPAELGGEQRTAPKRPPAESTARQPGPTPERMFASPLVRRMAEERGIDLSQVRGSGPGGRIVKQDLEAYANHLQPPGAESRPQPQPEPATPPAAPRTGKKEPFSRMRATIAKRMAESMREIPHFYVTCEIDMSEVVRLRAALKASDRVAADVTYTHFIVKAVAIALERHPRLNASYVEDGRELKAEINLGLAVALDDGLIVPVLHGCDKLSLLEIAAQANALVERARAGKPTSEDLSGGTFTISNLGMLPVEHFTAIINPPQGAILATGAIKERPVVREGQVRVAHTMMATLSCDHRILDGVTGGQFLAELKRLLENPVGLMV